MPAAATLVNNTSTAAFVVPPGALGFVVWNTSTAALRIRIAATAAASGSNEGMPLPAGSATDPKYMTLYFAGKLVSQITINIFQDSGANITSGVGYEILKF